MAVYLINVFLIFIWAYLLLLNKPSQKKKASFCAIVAVQWILISGLRGLSVGADTYAYYQSFERQEMRTWESIFNAFVEYLRNNTSSKDPGYYILTKGFQIFFDNYRAFLFFIAILFTALLAIWIYKNSSMPCLSFVIYSVLFYSFFSITGHRQTIATALIVFAGDKYVRERKPVQFFILVIIAFFIHKSSIVFAIYYFIANVKITKRYVALYSCLCVVVVIGGKVFYEPIALSLGFAQEMIDYNYGGTGTFTVLMCVLFVASAVLYKQISNNREDSRFLYNAMFLMLPTSLLTIQNQGFMRVQQYFSIYIMLMIPELVKAIDKRYRIIVYIAGVAFMLFFLVRSNPQYVFFWQEAII